MLSCHGNDLLLQRLCIFVSMQICGFIYRGDFPFVYVPVLDGRSTLRVGLTHDANILYAVALSKETR
jgi:hypothetical protein